MEGNILYDTIVVGGGPIGLTCGIEAQRAGLRYVIFEKGCLVNSIYHFPTNMTFFSTSEKIEIGGVPFVAHGDKPTRREALEYYRRVKNYFALQLHTYEAVQAVTRSVEDETVFVVETSKRSYRTRSVVIATGFYDLPNLLGITGENLPKVKHYFDDAHPYADHKVVVVGGGNSAADVALETYYKGASVTMVVRDKTLKPSIKYWIKPNIENRIGEGSIRAFFESKLVAIRPDAVDIQTPDGMVTIANDFVLAMTGYRPNFEWLESIGIAFSNDAKRVPQFDETTFETNVKNVFLAGVVCGGMQTNKWFIENARYHAERVAATIRERVAESSVSNTLL